MQKIYTTITSREYYETILVDSGIGETCWSINKKANVGDLVLLYVCAPVSSIVATAIIADDVYLNDDTNSLWYGTHFAEMHELKMLQNSVTRKHLLELFPDWRYWTQPRNSIEVKSDYVVEIRNLIYKT